MQNNDLIGKIVLSKCGRDKKIQMPKKKSIKHFIVLENVDDEIKASVILKKKGTDLKIKRFLKLKGIVKEG